MEKQIGSVIYNDSIKDTFPFIESTIIKLDNNLGWWQKNYEILEDKMANIVSGVVDSPVNIRTRFTIYNGTDDSVETVEWNGPALEFTFIETSPSVIEKVKNKLGGNWEGHRILTEENKLYVLFE